MTDEVVEVVGVGLAVVCCLQEILYSEEEMSQAVPFVLEVEVAVALVKVVKEGLEEADGLEDIGPEEVLNLGASNLVGAFVLEEKFGSEEALDLEEVEVASVVEVEAGSEALALEDWVAFGSVKVAAQAVVEYYVEGVESVAASQVVEYMT